MMNIESQQQLIDRLAKIINVAMRAGKCLPIKRYPKCSCTSLPEVVCERDAIGVVRCPECLEWVPLEIVD